MKKALPLALSLLFALCFTATPAHAAEPSSTPLQQRIDEVLAKFPGGEQVAPNAVSWEKGAIVLELSGGATAARAVAGCASGAYCAWSKGSYTGDKLTFTACSATGSLVSLGPLTLLGGTKSLANARSSGTVTALNGTSTVVYAVAAGVGVPTFGLTATHLRCFT